MTGDTLEGAMWSLRQEDQGRELSGRSCEANSVWKQGTIKKEWWYTVKYL